MDWRDGALLLLAGYIAVSALTRLMAARRDQLIRATRNKSKRDELNADLELRAHPKNDGSDGLNRVQVRRALRLGLR